MFVIARINILVTVFVSSVTEFFVDLLILFFQFIKIVNWARRLHLFPTFEEHSVTETKCWEVTVKIVVFVSESK